MAKLSRFNDFHYIHFVTTRTWKNIPYFKDQRNCLILLKNIDRYRKEHSFRLLAYCIMPDHIHLLIEPRIFDTDGIKPSASRDDNYIKPSASEDENTQLRLGDGFTPSLIEDIIHDIKGKTAFDIRKYLNIVEKIWKRSFFDFQVYSEKKLEEKINYIHDNPIRAGLVKDLDDYPFSSYQNYYLDNDSLININY